MLSGSIVRMPRLEDIRKYNPRMATITVPGSPRRPQLRRLALMAVVFGLLVGFVIVWLNAREPSAQETYRSLASSSFTEDLPLGIELDRRGTRQELGRVSFFDLRKSRRAEGGIVVVSYQVYPSRQAALSAYQAYCRDLREANATLTRKFRFFETKIARPHMCVAEVDEYCHAVAGNVTLEALSRIHMFEPREPSHVGAILDAALDHLDRTVESG
jgi:hypothetical protein